MEGRESNVTEFAVFKSHFVIGSRNEQKYKFYFLIVWLLFVISILACCHSFPWPFSIISVWNVNNAHCQWQLSKKTSSKRILLRKKCGKKSVWSTISPYLLVNVGPIEWILSILDNKSHTDQWRERVEERRSMREYENKHLCKYSKTFQTAARTDSTSEQRVWVVSTHYYSVKMQFFSLFPFFS